MARILAMDKGPGIPNIAEAMSDGYSTAGTMGGGMGAMKRIATRFDVFTGPTGTIVLLEIGKDTPGRASRLPAWPCPIPESASAAMPGARHQTPERTVALVVDGLGHGWGAAEAAQEAVAIFRKRVRSGPGEILCYMHDALRKTRGAVAAIAEIRPKENARLRRSGKYLRRRAERRRIAKPGFAQRNPGSGDAENPGVPIEWPPDAVLVLHSDGLQSRWDLSPYAGLLSRHPAVIGGALLRDFRRQRDDASVVVVKAA